MNVRIEAERPEDRHTPFHKRIREVNAIIINTKTRKIITLECGHMVQTFGDLKHAEGVILCQECRAANEAAQAEGRKFYEQLYPASEYHDDLGTVLWWHLPVREPPEVGMSPDDLPEGYPDGWHTHFSRIPVVWQATLNAEGGPRHPIAEPPKPVTDDPDYRAEMSEE